MKAILEAIKELETKKKTLQLEITKIDESIDKLKDVDFNLDAKIIEKTKTRQVVKPKQTKRIYEKPVSSESIINYSKGLSAKPKNTGDLKLSAATEHIRNNSSKSLAELRKEVADMFGIYLSEQMIAYRMKSKHKNCINIDDALGHDDNSKQVADDDDISNLEDLEE